VSDEEGRTDKIPTYVNVLSDEEGRTDQSLILPME